MAITRLVLVASIASSVAAYFIGAGYAALWLLWYYSANIKE